MLVPFFNKVAGLNYWILLVFHSPYFHFRNHTQNNSLIRKHVMYLVKKHLNVHSIYCNGSFLERTVLVLWYNAWTKFRVSFHSQNFNELSKSKVNIPLYEHYTSQQHLPFSTRGYLLYIFPLSNNIFSFSQRKCLA